MLYADEKIEDHRPWLATGQTLYQWIADRPELYCGGHWNMEPVKYRYLGMAKEPPQRGVYFLLSDSGGILYIGKSNNMYRRLQAHGMARVVPFTHVWWIATPEECTAPLESYLLSVGMPPYNSRFDGPMQSMADELEHAIDAADV